MFNFLLLLRDAFEDGDFKEEDAKIWIGIDRDDVTSIKDFAKREDKLRLLKRLKDFLDAFECY